MQPFLAVALALTTGVAAPPKVAVLDLQTSGIDPEHGPLLTEVLTTEFDALGLFRVISGDDVRAMLGHEAQMQMMGCEDTGCLAEIGGALGADLILASRVGRLGESYVLTVKLVNVRSTRTEARIYDTAAGEIDALVALIRTSIRKLGREVREKRAAEARASGADEGTHAADDTPGEKAPAVAAAGEGARTAAPAGAVGADEVTGARRGPGLGPIVLLSAGGLGLAVGGASGLQAADLHDQVMTGAYPGQQADIAAGQAAQTRANVAFAAGGAAAVAGLVWWLLEPSGSSPAADAAAVSVIPALGSAPGLSAVVTW